MADTDLRQINIYQCTNSIDPHISESIPPRPLGTNPDCKEHNRMILVPRGPRGRESSPLFK
jgi:hypothetical protein